MHPILIRIGPLTIPSYGFLFASGVLLGILVILRLAKREGLDVRVVGDFLFYVLLFGLLGAKLLLLVTNLNYYLRFPGEIRYLLTSGGTFFGGLIGGVIFAAFFIRRKRMNFRSLADITVFGLTLGHFFGRLGCLAAGCCWGRPAGRFPLAVTFTSRQANQLTGVPLNRPLYPTQPLEAVLNLINFFVLWIVYRRRRFKGQVFVIYLFNYSLIRLLMEYFRGDPDRGYVWGSQAHPFISLSIPQLICLFGLAAAVALYRIFKKKGEKENPA